MDFKRIQWQRECLRHKWKLGELTQLWTRTASLDLWIRWIAFCEQKPEHKKLARSCPAPEWAQDHYLILHEEKTIHAINWEDEHIAGQNIEYILTLKALHNFASSETGKMLFYSDVLSLKKIPDEVWKRHREYMPRWAQEGISLRAIEKYYRQEVTAQEVCSYVNALTKNVSDLSLYLIKYHIPLSAVGTLRVSAIDEGSASLWIGEVLNEEEERALFRAFKTDFWQNITFNMERKNPYLRYLSSPSGHSLGVIGSALKKQGNVLKADAFITWKEHILRLDFSKKYRDVVNKDWVYLCEYAALCEKDPQWLSQWTAEQLKPWVNMGEWPEEWLLLKNWVEEGEDLPYLEYLSRSSLYEEEVYFE